MIINYCMLNLNKNQVAALFESHNEALKRAGELPEIQDLLFVSKPQLETFLRDPNVYSYIPPAARRLHYEIMS